MALVEYPMHIIPNSASIAMRGNTKVFKSKFNGSTKTARFNGNVWVLTLNFKNLDWEIPELSAFMFSLDGQSGRVMLPTFHAMGKPPMGSPVVKTAGQSGGIVESSDWLKNQVVLRVGEYISINNEIKIITKDIVSDNLGNATLEFAPWLRESPDVGTEIVTDAPSGRFMLEEDQAQLDIDPDNGSASLTFVEAFYV